MVGRTLVFMYRAHVSRWSNRQLPQVATHELVDDEEDCYDIKRGVMDTLILDGLGGEVVASW